MRAKKTIPALFRLARFTLLVAFVALLLSASSAPAATPMPAWSLSAASQPTNFAPGTTSPSGTGGFAGIPQYSIVATNIGSASTSEPITITAVLPTGLTAVEPTARVQSGGSLAPCDVVAQTVTCIVSSTLQPGEWVQVAVQVEVAIDASPTLTTEVSIEGGGALPASTATTTTISSAVPLFGFLPTPAGHAASGLSSLFTDIDGAPVTQAGKHPYQLTVDLGLPSLDTGEGFGFISGGVANAGHLRNLTVNLPRGALVNPNSTPVLCTEAQLEDSSIGCPPASQVGAISLTTIITSVVPSMVPLYNMVPPAGTPAAFGFNALSQSIYVHVMGGVRAGSDYGLSATSKDILARFLNPVLAVQTQLWGNPSDPSHDSLRGKCLISPQKDFCPITPTTTPLLTMPSACTPVLTTTVSASSWEEPDQGVAASGDNEDSVGTPAAVSGCNALQFDPTIEAKPTTNLADSPSGLEFNLHQPQSQDPQALAVATMKDITVTLPEEITVNPSSADGQDACSVAEIGLTTAIGEKPIHFTVDPANCPNASKLGSVEVTTPLLKDPLPGAVYLAEPYENPFGSLLAIYLTVHDENQGVVAKLAGKITPHTRTGQLTARFEENPQLPLEDVDVNFFGGPRASLRTPALCGDYTTTADLTPWSAPEGQNAHPEDSFAIQANPNGGNCPTSKGSAPHSPSFSAGTLDPVAGAFSPFVLRVSRQDATQEISAIDATLPQGLTARLAGVPYCPEASIAQARQREQPNQGALELSSPSCPASSQVGEVDVAAGAGITPLHVAGKAYLAGPYKSAPLSLVVITPAVAGPFDLGAVVVRTALQVDSKTAQVKATSDPLPTIIEGIPLDVRSITVDASKPQFSLNPTSCDPMEVGGSATSVLSQTASLKSPFQVGGCKALPFKPKIQIKLKGKTNRGAHPALTATATFSQGHANTKRAAVTLPRSAFLDQGHIRTVCTRVQFAADQCPKAAIYGFARAFTPLLDKPLEGPVYLRSSNNELPDLVADLKGQVDFELIGRVDSVNGGIRNTFEAAPDAPVSRFVLKMQGGSKGLLQNSENLCRASKEKRRATVKMDAHNGKVNDFRPVVKNDCGRKGRRGKDRRG